MKTVNRFKLILFASFLTLTACSSDTVRVSSMLKETPEISKTNMSSALSCMSTKIKYLKSDNAFVFVVRDMDDGTIKKGPYQNSPLSDAGRIQMLSVLSNQLQPHVGLVMDNFPWMFKQLSKEKVGLNRLGQASGKNMASFIGSYSRLINSARKRKQLAPLKGIMPLVVSGSFTRFDTDNIFQDGSGHNAGSRARGSSDDDHRRASGTADIGETSSSKAISLVVNLIDPRHNIVVGSQSFDLMFHRKNKTFRLRAAVGDVFYGLSKRNVYVEGVHSAQKTLIDAAALWILNKSYGRHSDFSVCYTEKQKLLTLEQMWKTNETKNI